MPCYIRNIKPPTKSDYHAVVGLGFTGTWEQFCDFIGHSDAARIMFFCGELGQHCADCADMGVLLCDYPVGDGKTCDRTVCDEHAHEIGPDLHYCEAHYKMWQNFKERGGVDKVLRNIIAFKHEK